MNEDLSLLGVVIVIIVPMTWLLIMNSVLGIF